MVAGYCRSHAWIDTDKQHTQAWPDAILEAQLGPVRLYNDLPGCHFKVSFKGSIMNWLVKEEPTHYSFDDLVRDGRTAWTGVRNPLAQKHLQSMRKGDRIFFYHTGDVKAVVGIAKAASAPYPDPADKTGKLYAVDLVPVEKLKSPVTLAAVKATRHLHHFRWSGYRVSR